MTPLIAADTVLRVPPDQTPDYNSRNLMTKLLAVAEAHHLAAEQHFYLTDHLHALVPFSHLDLAGPQGADADILDPTRHDNKTDFQKQNVRDFLVTDTYLLRGWVTACAWKNLEAFEPVPDRVVPFLKLSYRASPDSKLAETMGRLPGRSILLLLKVNVRDASGLITVPCKEATDRYEIDLWGDHGSDLRAVFSAGADTIGLSSLDSGDLITRPDLILGQRSDFDRENKDDLDIVPCRDQRQAAWGVDVPHYRNLMSNYLGFAGSGELGRIVEPWQLDFMGRKSEGERHEGFLAIDYIDFTF
ncbi:hypothetical protein I6F35_35380 [Bradyrhizobium sp. BRP22]|uniref:hypothetical protein n=1 Tax=Bradyrhizobium sp. BRP22 TaxID=2793821 RepID=UPI001CD7D4A3|nr:hypothetical protein [Bradyrhizobium sp. BRP22]MCA1458400.1 hypothetical protein [Bradyrhizobium sp. BRP22]